jgi:hypothetical protein
MIAEAEVQNEQMWQVQCREVVEIMLRMAAEAKEAELR